MGDRFYEEQKRFKPTRRLKRDIVVEVNRLLPAEVPGLDKLTKNSLEILENNLILLLGNG